MDTTIAQTRAIQETLAATDPVSEDLVIEALRGLEKQRWMLAAQVEKR